MRLGTIMGGKAWAELNEAARKKRREVSRKRKDRFDKAKRRRELDEAGFKAPVSWDYGSDSCGIGARR